MTDFPYWKIESVTCTRTGSESLFSDGFVFTIKGVGLGDWDRSTAPLGSFAGGYTIYLEDEVSGNRFRFPGGNTKWFPNTKQGQPFEITFGAGDSDFEHIKFTGFIFDRYSLF